MITVKDAGLVVGSWAIKENMKERISVGSRSMDSWMVEVLEE